MTDFEATMIAEGVTEAETQEQYIAAWQQLIDTGLCWRLQGWFGRTATELIAAEICKPRNRVVHQYPENSLQNTILNKHKTNKEA
tara:strand:+ start:244 stop:498 length:255 start_codon:yes stop_codon:yes gene_type:complete